MSIFLSYNSLASMLNVSYPLLALDNLSIDKEKTTASGIRQVTANETIFMGHFPSHPILPGVLQVAAMAQASKALLMTCFPGDGVPVLAGLSRVKFRKPVLPGSCLHLECESMGQNEHGAYMFNVRNTVDGELASAGVVTMLRKDANALLPGAPRSECLPLISPDADSPAAPAGIDEILKFIPHRIPFVMIDRAFNLGKGESAQGFKNITASDAMMQGSPNGIFPGYLQIEAAAQLGCAHLLSQPDNIGKLGIFLSIDSATFLTPVFVGDCLNIQATCKFGGRFGIAEANLFAGSTKVSQTTFKFIIADASVIQQ